MPLVNECIPTKTGRKVSSARYERGSVIGTGIVKERAEIDHEAFTATFLRSGPIAKIGNLGHFQYGQFTPLSQLYYRPNKTAKAA